VPDSIKFRLIQPKLTPSSPPAVLVITRPCQAGATAIFAANPFERRFRDINTVTQQVQARTTHFETVGAHLLGLSPPLRHI